ncbi:MAG: hypothetical protein K0R50_2156 [Eubacterium sp.]|jgi:flagellar protein FliO/FliZ|nr:hypothetical protein [Eubacterium sp.]
MFEGNIYINQYSVLPVGDKMDILQIFSVIFAFIIVLGILLLTTKYLAYKSKTMMKGKYMHIVESLSLGVNNRLHLVKVDKEFFIISASNKNVDFLAKVNISDFANEEIKNPISEVIDFKSVLTKYVGSFGKQSKTKEGKPEEIVLGGKPSENEETTINDAMFRNNLEKLKNITNSMNDKGL